VGEGAPGVRTDILTDEASIFKIKVPVHWPHTAFNFRLAGHKATPKNDRSICGSIVFAEFVGGLPEPKVAAILGWKYKILNANSRK
jgi:hypothetical protein